MTGRRGRRGDISSLHPLPGLAGPPSPKPAGGALAPALAAEALPLSFLQPDAGAVAGFTAATGSAGEALAVDAFQVHDRLQRHPGGGRDPRGARRAGPGRDRGDDPHPLRQHLEGWSGRRGRAGHVSLEGPRVPGRDRGPRPRPHREPLPPSRQAPAGRIEGHPRNCSSSRRRQGPGWPQNPIALLPDREAAPPGRPGEGT